VFSNAIGAADGPLAIQLRVSRIGWLRCDERSSDALLVSTFEDATSGIRWRAEHRGLCPRRALLHQRTLCERTVRCCSYCTVSSIRRAHPRLVLHGWLAAWQLRDFDSVEAVMAHMQFLDGNASAYDEYLVWKVRHLPVAESCVSSLRVASTPLSHADSSDCY
jgi:hypothetical protein